MSEPLQNLQDHEKGVSFNCDYDLGPDERKRIMKSAIEEAEMMLPSGSIFEIRAKLRPQDPGALQKWSGGSRTEREVAQDWGICWYWTEAMQSQVAQLFLNDVDNGEIIKEGCLLLARMKVE